MTNIRAMFIGQGPSGLPEDRVVNTFHFQSDLDFALGSLAVIGAVTDFYTGVGTSPNVQANTLSSYLSPWVSRTAEIRTYNLADAKPRVPITTALTLSDGQQLTGYPEEVALCISVTGGAPFTARRRGRVFLGPLIPGSGTPANTENPTRPTAAFMLDCAKAALRMATAGGSTAEWVIRSERPTENFVTITRGWVDNAFDTQRRRGPKSTTRKEWTELLGIIA
jgi:hypothetical protein